MEVSAFGIFRIFYCARSALVHTVLQDGHQLVRIKGPSLLNSRRERVYNTGVSIRVIGRRHIESFHIALNKGFCVFIGLNPTAIGVRGYYIVSIPLSDLPELIFLGLYIDADLYSRNLELACLSGKRKSHWAGKDRENDMGL